MLFNNFTLKYKKKEWDFLYKKNVQELYEEFEYGNSIIFTIGGFDLEFRRNKNIQFRESSIEVELKKIVTIFDGVCYKMEFSDLILDRSYITLAQ